MRRAARPAGVAEAVVPFMARASFPAAWQARAMVGQSVSEYHSAAGGYGPARRPAMELHGGEPVWRGEAAACPESPAPAPDRKVQLIEVCVFLSLIVPSMVLSLFVVRQGSLPFVLVAASAIVRDASFLALILFLLWRNGEPVRRIGWTHMADWKEAVLGMGFYAPFFFVTGLLGGTLRAAGFSTPSTPVPSFLTPKGPAQFVLALLLVAVVALAEETIFRGYLILLPLFGLR